MLYLDCEDQTDFSQQKEPLIIREESSCKMHGILYQWKPMSCWVFDERGLLKKFAYWQQSLSYFTKALLKR